MTPMAARHSLARRAADSASALDLAQSYSTPQVSHVFNAANMQGYFCDQTLRSRSTTSIRFNMSYLTFLSSLTLTLKIGPFQGFHWSNGHPVAEWSGNRTPVREVSGQEPPTLGSVVVTSSGVRALEAPKRGQCTDERTL